jgi:transposase-like protein
MALESDHSLTSVARQINVNKNTLYGWVRQHQETDSPGNDTVQSLKIELFKVQRENEQLREKCDKLRKAA